MNKQIIYILLAIIIALSSYFFIVNMATNPPITTTYNTLNLNPIMTGTTEPNDVAIELTPKRMEDGRLEVEISANTHSVALEQFNLQQITTLEYNGKMIKPFSVPKLSGHHSSGSLIFNMDKSVTSFTIKITGIPNVEERVFKW